MNERTIELIVKLYKPFGVDQFFSNSEAFINKYSICELLLRKATNPAERS